MHIRGHSCMYIIEYFERMAYIISDVCVVSLCWSACG